MTSPVFWLSFAAVFLAIRWVAERALLGAPVEVRRVRPPIATFEAAAQALADEPWSGAVDKAA